MEAQSKGAQSLFSSLSQIGHKAEDDVFTWSQGLAFHYANFIEALSDVEKEKRERILKDIWSAISEKAPETIKEKVGLIVPIDVEKIGETLSQILNDSSHPAIKGSGKDIDESILNWVRLFALLDFNIYMKLEEHLGTKDGYPRYMGLWEKFALAELDHVKKAVKISGADDVDMDKLGELSKVYWESIACPYKVTKHDANIHEAELLACPYWDNMKEILGEDVARSMTLKCEAAVSVNYYQAILQALGVFDRYSFTMDRFLCCGDDACRVRFEKRK
ncbi:MAG TPA: hypothetical protein VMW89_07045 [Desulfatiglandales bacterium]|nr:hypothetical protein [Desulfatiglandales bacterium]